MLYALRAPKKIRCLKTGSGTKVDKWDPYDY